MAFKTQVFTGLYGSSVLSYGVGDFNADGRLDFMYSGPVTPFQDRAQTFTMVSIDPNGTVVNNSSIFASAPKAIHPREMYVGDLNNDGVDDFFSANHGYDAPPYPGEPNTLMLSSGGKLIDHSKQVGRAAFSHSIAGGDIDNDGDTDLFVGVLGRLSDGDYGPYFMINDGAGRFSVSDISVPAFIDGKEDMGRFTAAILTDIDNDGWSDLVVGSEENGATSGITFLNDRNGAFDEATQQLLPTGSFGGYGTITTDVIEMDVNRDGYVDLILAQTDGDPFYQGQLLQVLVNDGAGRFHDETESRIEQDGFGNWIQNLKTIDFQ